MTSQQEILVQLEGVTAGNRHRTFVHNVSLSVSRGEIVTLIGPNGSGKSTTAKLALGIVAADQGKVERARGLRVGYVPQRLSLDPTLPLTVDRLMRLTGPSGNGEVQSALERTGVAHTRKAQVDGLSGGEFQRVLLARAIARTPDLLVLDEPVQGVDFIGELALYDLISEIRDELNCGILLVSHDLHLVMAATDRVVCLNGHICCEGSPRAVAESREYRELFGARASQTLAVYAHHHDHTHLPDGSVRHSDGTISDHCSPAGEDHHAG